MALRSSRLFGAIRPYTGPLISRTIVSKALKEPKEKPAPFPYLEKKFTYLGQIFDKTTLRLDENSKLVVVDGAHNIGKTDLAKKLAEEFDMMYIGPPNMDDIFVDLYGVDARKYGDLIPDFFRPFDHVDFIKNPTGEGRKEHTVDRYSHRVYFLKWINQLKAIRHILNTGQGVVMEGCVNSDYIHFEAAYQAGYVSREMRELFYIIQKNTIREVLRPNLIVYLDAPVDVVQRNMKASSNEWDRNSPLWNNSQYLNAIYSEYKNNFLKDIQQHSRVLVYDWSQGGDVEVVVEDIENVELDMIEKYSDQQKDWRFHDEPGASMKRHHFTSRYYVTHKIMTHKVDALGISDILVASGDDSDEFSQLFRVMDQGQGIAGANEKMGQEVPLITKLTGYYDDYKIWAKLSNQWFWPELHEYTLSPEEVKQGVGLAPPQ